MNIKKILLPALLCAGFFQAVKAQQAPDIKGGFRKDRLFTGGSLSLGFGTGFFLGGVNPMLGYELTNWVDAGIALNLIYTQQRYVQSDFAGPLDDKSRQTLYGGGLFTRIYPVRFLFAQAQYEHNFINFKYYPPNGANPISDNRQAPSLLVGGGYTTGRQPGEGGSYGYLSVLWDVAKDPNSPYTDRFGRATPQIRAGINIPLFRGRRARGEEGGDEYYSPGR